MLLYSPYYGGCMNYDLKEWCEQIPLIKKDIGGFRPVSGKRMPPVLPKGVHFTL